MRKQPTQPAPAAPVKSTAQVIAELEAFIANWKLTNNPRATYWMAINSGHSPLEAMRISGMM